ADASGLPPDAIAASTSERMILPSGPEPVIDAGSRLLSFASFLARGDILAMPPDFRVFARAGFETPLRGSSTSKFLSASSTSKFLPASSEGAASAGADSFLAAGFETPL